MDRRNEPEPQLFGADSNYANVGAALLPSAGRARSRCVNLSSAGAWCAPFEQLPR